MSSPSQVHKIGGLNDASCLECDSRVTRCPEFSGLALKNDF